MIDLTKPATEPTPSTHETCMTVPASALAVDGTSPSIGDDVEFTVKGKVSTVQGEDISIEPSEINGQSVDQAKKNEPEEKPEDMSGDAVMAAAQKADQGT